MKKHALTKKLDEIGIVWILDVDKAGDFGSGRRKKDPDAVMEKPLNTYPIIKKWPKNREWCNQCNQLVEDKIMKHKYIPETGMWRHKCSCGKVLTDICMSCIINKD
jgi:hypothetical protein